MSISHSGSPFDGESRVSSSVLAYLCCNSLLDQNDSHHENAYMETTIFDKLFGMNQEYEILCEIRGNH